SNKDQYTPTPVTTPVKTNENTTLTDEQAKDAIANNADLPTGTTYTWSKQPDTKTYGNTTGEVKVTYPDGTSESVTIPVQVNSDAQNYPIHAGNPVKVDNSANLTDPEKGAVKDAIIKANPTAPIDHITVKADGSTTVTFKDGSTTPLASNVLKKTDADKYPLTPGNTVKVADPKHLTNNEKGAVTTAITKANPTAPIKSVTVNDDGSAVVTYQDGSTTTVSANVTKKTDADKYPLTKGNPVKVNDPANLTDAEKGAVKDSLTKANPAAPIKNVTVNPDGSADVTFNDGSTTTVPANVLKKTDADKYPLTKGNPVKVNDPANLTDAEKGAVKDSLTKANPSAPIKNVAVNHDGSADVTFNDGSKTTVPANVLKKTDADKYPLVKGNPVKVNDPANLTDAEKGSVKGSLTKANPSAPIKNVAVNPDGSADVTFNDGSTTTVPTNVLKKTDADKYPLTKGNPVKVNNPANLTDTEKGEVKESLTKANPSAPIQTVSVNNNGSATVTFTDGSTTKVPANVIKKTDADRANLKPGNPVKVDNPANLTEPEKGEVKDAITKANPTAPIQTISVNNDGSATVTFTDETTTKLPANVIKKTDADKYPLTKGNPVKVNDPANLTAPEKAAVKESITKANPTAPIKAISVNHDGSATVTFTDGSTTKVPANVIKKTNADQYPLTAGNPVKVNDPAHLTEAEKGEVKDAIKQANPTAPIQSISVNNDGSATVTFNDGSTTTMPANVLKKTDADKYPLTAGNPVKVNDPANLTEAEKGEVKDAIMQANPTAPIKSISVNHDGSATVTFNDGSTTTMPANVLKKTDADKYPLTAGNPVKVNDPANLTEAEKGEVRDAIKQANPTAPIKSISVNNDGRATVTYQDGSTTTLQPNVTKKTDADKHPLVPGNPVKVTDPSHLSAEEKGEVTTAIKQANPTAPIKSVAVNDDGSATVTYQDGSLTTMPANTMKKTDADNYPLVPAKPVTVTDPTHLTATEKGQVSAGIKAANPTAPIKHITVNDDGSAVVTYQDGSTTTVPSNVTPATPTPTPTEADTTTLKPGRAVSVADPSHLTEPEKEQVSAGIKAANPTAPIKSITVNDDGSATVTYQDGSLTTLPANTTKKTDADQYPLVPAKPVTVTDPTHLTATEKGQVSVGIKTANPTAPIKHITVNDDGSAVVTYQDGSTTTVPSNVTKQPATDAERTPVVVPTQKVPVADPSHLSDAEKATVKDHVAAANPTATVTVANDGTATLTYQDGSTHTIAGAQLVVIKPSTTTTADQVTPIVPSGKVPVTDPSHLSDAEKATVKDHVATVNQGNFPAGTTLTVADDGTVTITYPDGSVTTLAESYLVATKPATGDQTTAVTTDGNRATQNGQATSTAQLGRTSQTKLTTPPAKSQAKTLPQTGNEQGSLLAASGLGMLLLGLLGLGGKRKKED
uniref:Rib/alpha-like domain-containing protein n=1 Tax=Limosilactobacillus ingluviei TaxID=148604 RepID=UPI0024BB981F